MTKTLCNKVASFTTLLQMFRAEKGFTDGLQANSKGNIFASGPGGIWIFNQAGTVLGKIKIPEAATNCALSPDEKTLYITSDMYLLRLKMRD
ncbi:MAG: SMP-30/gluconolactonase/LRE family protein [Cytophagales bacterium]|nr:SMP-30/gluconolactonase/LRE family protein [Cytophagales bacterium]